MRRRTTHRSADPSIPPRPSGTTNGGRAVDVRREAREEYRRVEAPEELSPERIYAILPAGHGPRGADVFDEQQTSIRTQDAPDLPERQPLVRDRTQNKRRDDGIEAVVGKGQRLGPGRRNLDGKAGGQTLRT